MAQGHELNCRVSGVSQPLISEKGQLVRPAALKFLPDTPNSRSGAVSINRLTPIPLCISCSPVLHSINMKVRPDTSTVPSPLTNRIFSCYSFRLSFWLSSSLLLLQLSLLTPKLPILNQLIPKLPIQHQLTPKLLIQHQLTPKMPTPNPPM